MSEKLYWLGNSAKTRVISEIIRRSSGQPTTVFDYGAGRGGDWDVILADHPHLSLVAYEPYTPSREALVQKLHNQSRARVVGDAELAGVSFAADFIVSFSVFEHVYDRAAYLKNLRYHLASHGVVFLNYDDGHFRQALQLDQPKTWPPALVEHVRNVLAHLWPKVGRAYLYQERVRRAELDQLLATAQLRSVATVYENVADFKHLIKHLPTAQKASFARFWLEVEARLNLDFSAETTASRGDTAALWRICPSRTLELVGQ